MFLLMFLFVSGEAIAVDILAPDLDPHSFSTSPVPPLSSCFTQDTTWSISESSDIIPQIPSYNSCQDRCLQSPNCNQFTWYSQLAAPLDSTCFLFDHPTTEYGCSNCISGPQSCTYCTISSCKIVEDNFISLVPHVETEIHCQDHCLKMENCSFYTWFQEDSVLFPNLCFMFSSCQEKTFSCNSCHSGPRKCPTTTPPPSIITSYSTTTSTTTTTTINSICNIPEPQKHGDWFCPPSPDPATCHLECHPGYVSTNSTVITCQQHQWTEAPECITAVAIITGGGDSKNTVEVYGEGINKKLPNLPDNRYSHSIQLVNSVLLLCSGIFGIFTNPSCLSLTASHQWRTHSTTTSPRYWHSSVSMMGQLYLLGGYKSRSTTEHLTPPSQDWASGWDLLEDTYSACAAKIEPEVFIVIGGYDYPRSVVAYNVTSGGATRLKDLNTPRMDHGCSLVMDSNMKGVLVAGGVINNGNYLRKSEIYDVNTGEWSTTGKLTTGRRGVRLVVLGNKILAMGGYDGSYNDLSTVEKFNLTTRQWTRTEDMMEKRSYHAMTGVPSTAVEIATN